MLKISFTALVLILFLSRAGAQPTPGTVLWSFDFGDPTSYGNPVTASWCPTLAPDGTLYMGRSAGLFAITNNGTLGAPKWILTNITEATAPALASDATIYVYSHGSAALYAVNPDGSIRWSTNFPGSYASPVPAISRDNTIYLALDGALHAYTASGREKWKTACTNLGDYVAPAVALDGTIYIGGFSANSLYAINPDGTVKWEFALPPEFRTLGESVAIGGDGTIYTCAAFDEVHAISPQGDNLWTAHSASAFAGSAAIGPDGTIYLGDFGGLNAFSPSGTLKWHAVFDGYWHNTPRPAVPAIDANGLIYYCISNNVFAFSSAGEVRWISPGLPCNDRFSAVVSPVLAADGTLYTCIATKLYAIACGSPPADTPWPTERQNSRHTGKVEKPWLTQPRQTPDGTFQFQLFAQLGDTNRVQASSDLAAWTSLGEFVVTNVPLNMVDRGASNLPSRFYRSLRR